MKARACLGRYAQNAYCFKELDIAVYCMEELAFCLKENAFVLDTEIMNDDLLHFIGTECQVQELARQLYPMVHQKGSLSGFVSAILNYVGFFEETDVSKVEETVRRGSGLTIPEKKKLQVDHLAEQKQYMAALDGYDGLIRDMQTEDKSAKTDGIIADLYYNRAVVFANMLLYNQAAASFRKSYELKKDKQAIEGYFFAKRMELSEQEYIALVAKHPECYDISMHVEQKLQELESLWEESPESMGLSNMRHWRMTGDTHKYYEECEQVINILKEDYRNCV